VDIALAESLNALWKHVEIHRDLKEEDARSAVQDLAKIWDKLNILTTRELLEKALDIALTQKMTIYDSIYIAATTKLNATLYTADRKLHNTSKKITASKLLKL
jgi:predicted nucleic acid-binding protein